MTDQTTRLPIRRALISVSDKTGVVDFARKLVALGVKSFPPAAPTSCSGTTASLPWKWPTTPASRK